MKQVTIAHLYPEEMNIYGDWGNIVALRKRLEWRGIESKYEQVTPGAGSYDFSRADIVFGGGGQDSGQHVVANDLQKRGLEIKRASDSGVVFLLVCGMYQLFGNRFITSDEREIEGIGIFDAETVASPDRLIGNVVVQSEGFELVGFENHSGKTFLSPGQAALGRVVKGHGNNGQDGFEGAISGNTFGTYLHGSLLPKNPKFADDLLSRALKRKYGEDNLIALDDECAQKAAEVAKSRPQ